MTSLFAVLIFCSCLALNSSSSASSTCSDRDLWSYKQAGTDPPNWGKHYPNCKIESKNQQSPIDINTNNVQGPFEFKIRHNYGDPPKANTYYTTKNVGRTIKMEFGETDYYFEVDGRRFKPLQVHIHFGTPLGSEHALNGMRYPAEIHIVHKQVGANKFLVLGVFVEVVNGFSSSTGLRQLLYHIENIRNPYDGHKNVVKAFPLYNFFPFGGNGIDKPDAKYKIINYTGSLTTPGCNGGVQWYVVTGATLTLSSDMLERLKRSKNCYGESLGGNFRFIQPVKSFTTLRGSNYCL